MRSFSSERTLRRAAIGSMALLAVAATAFHVAQNTAQPVGGSISVPKMLWLAGAVLLWVVLPLLLMADPRLGPALRRPFAVLAALMLARAVVEGWMLYVSRNWSPWYGIAHDTLCAVVLVAFAAASPPGGGGDPHAPHPPVHLWMTAAFFAPEIYFAWYMQAHFVTHGAGAVYFVPDDVAYADVLRVTTIAVVCLALYLGIFLWRWMPAKGEQRR
ncbi:MAG: hypothetical protein WD801_07075 [Gemmatimonadaceae bacterium]